MSDPALAFFRADAESQGLSMAQYAAKYGIVLERERAQAAAHEEPLIVGHIEQGHCSACTSGGERAD